MKKIMVMLAAVAMAACSQAAFVDWSASSLSDYKTKTFYLFDSSKQSTILGYLSAVDTTTASKLESAAFYTGTTTSKGKATAFSVNVGEVTKMSIFALVLAGDIKAGTGYRYIVEDVSGNLYTPPATPTAFTSALATSGTNGTMSAGGPEPTPEPTSGLLLLLGVAGLALRRKQK